MLYPRSAPSPLTGTPFPNQPVNGAPIGSPTPFNGTGGTVTPNGQTDDASILAWLKSIPGIDPSIVSNPQYWIDKVKETGGLSPGNAGYWSDRMLHPRDAASGGAGGTSPIGFGQFLQPYTGTFAPPTGTDDPGFQFALNEGLGAIQRSAAAKGNLLTGGVMKDLTKYATGSALQDYAGAFNRSLQTFGTNYDVFRNNQQDPYARLLATSQLGLNAAAPYAAQQTNLTTGAGNANALNSVNAGNALQPAITAFGNWFQSRQPPRNSGVTGLPPANSSLLGG